MALENNSYVCAQLTLVSSWAFVSFCGRIGSRQCWRLRFHTSDVLRLSMEKEPKPQTGRSGLESDTSGENNRELVLPIVPAVALVPRFPTRSSVSPIWAQWHSPLWQLRLRICFVPAIPELHLSSVMISSMRWTILFSPLTFLLHFTKFF